MGPPRPLGWALPSDTQVEGEVIWIYFSYGILLWSSELWATRTRNTTHALTQHSAGCVWSVQTEGGLLRVGVGCTRYTAALHRHDLCLPPGQRQSGTPVKFFQLQLAKLSFGQLSAWAGLAPAGQGSLGDADPSSGPTGSAPSRESKLTAGSCCGPASYPYF